MNCKVCGHSINEHSTLCDHHDVINPANWVPCKCLLSANDIAQERITALETAGRDARIALTFYREWMFEQDESQTEYPFGKAAERNLADLLNNPPLDTCKGFRQAGVKGK